MNKGQEAAAEMRGVATRRWEEHLRPLRRLEEADCSLMTGQVLPLGLEQAETQTPLVDLC